MPVTPLTACRYKPSTFNSFTCTLSVCYICLSLVVQHLIEEWRQAYFVNFHFHICDYIHKNKNSVNISTYRVHDCATPFEIHTPPEIYRKLSTRGMWFSKRLTHWATPFKNHTYRQHFGLIFQRGCTHFMWKCPVGHSMWNLYSLWERFMVNLSQGAEGGDF